MSNLDEILATYRSTNDLKWQIEPFPHQRILADWHVDHRCSIDQSEVGAGKTMPMVVVLQEFFDAAKSNRALIVATASILDSWAAELRRSSNLKFEILRGTKQKRLEALARPAQCYLVNYEALRTIFTELQAKNFDTIILDECFPWEASVETAAGSLPIGLIVDRHLDIPVLSQDLETGRWQWSRISRYIKKTLMGDLVRVGHEAGAFVCTPNHKIWTEDGYIEAEQLRKGATLRLVRNDVCNTIRSSGAKAFLQHFMFSQVAHVATGGQRDISKSGEGETVAVIERAYPSRHCGEDAQQESNETRIGTAQGSPNAERASVQAARWEWSFDAASENYCIAYRVDYGIYDSDFSGQVSICRKDAEWLQGGPRASGNKDSNRDRRPVSQASFQTSAGSEKTIGVSRSRVVSLEILKRGSPEWRRACQSSDQCVYNLEIEGIHNYVANGVLVSNCHHIKNPKAQQTKCALWLGKNAQHRKIMTGTLLTNNLEDVWAPAQFVDPRIFRTNFWGFRNQYLEDANAGKPWLKFPKWQPRPGAAAQVKQALAPYSIGFRKREVMKFLPPVVQERRVVELSPEQRAAYNDLKREFILELKDGAVITAPNILARITKLLEIASGFVYHNDEVHHLSSAKMAALEDVIESIGDSQALIWAAFTEDVRRIAAMLKCPQINGEVKAADRQPIVDAFNRGETKYLVCHPACAGEGLTILAPYSIYYSRSWKLGERLQSLGRFDRPGAEKHESLTVIDIVAERTVDVEVETALNGKEDLLKSITPQMARRMLEG